MNPTDVVEAPSEVLENSDTLTIHDRCDKCGAQAYVSVMLATGELHFCSHDWNEIEAKISDKAQAVVDERWKLNKTTKLDVSA